MCGPLGLGLSMQTGEEVGFFFSFFFSVIELLSQRLSFSQALEPGGLGRWSMLGSLCALK